MESDILLLHVIDYLPTSYMTNLIDMRIEDDKEEPAIPLDMDQKFWVPSKSFEQEKKKPIDLWGSILKDKEISAEDISKYMKAESGGLESYGRSTICSDDSIASVSKSESKQIEQKIIGEEQEPEKRMRLLDYAENTNHDALSKILSLEDLIRKENFYNSPPSQVYKSNVFPNDLKYDREEFPGIEDQLVDESSLDLNFAFDEINFDMMFQKEEKQKQKSAFDYTRHQKLDILAKVKKRQEENEKEKLKADGFERKLKKKAEKIVKKFKYGTMPNSTLVEDLKNAEKLLVSIPEVNQIEENEKDIRRKKTKKLKKHKNNLKKMESASKEKVKNAEKNKNKLISEQNHFMDLLEEINSDFLESTSSDEVSDEEEKEAFIILQESIKKERRLMRKADRMNQKENAAKLIDGNKEIPFHKTAKSRKLNTKSNSDTSDSWEPSEGSISLTYSAQLSARSHNSDANNNGESHENISNVVDASLDFDLSKSLKLTKKEKRRKLESIKKNGRTAYSQ